MGEQRRAETGRLAGVVEEAERRLSRISGRVLLRRRGLWVFAMALTIAASRPLLWPLPEDALLLVGALRACAMGLVVSLVGLFALVVVGRRQGPRALEAARALDDAQAHPEVVASGWAFLGRDEGDADGALVALAVHRAEAAAARVDVAAAFPLPRLWPNKKRIAACVPLLLLAIAVGAYDPVRVAALLDPPTALETAGADVLARAAERLAETAADQTREPEGERNARTGRGAREDRERQEPLSELADRARRAADAARRGDRERALSELSEVGRAGRDRRARERALSRTLSRLSDSLESRPPTERRSRGASSPSESLRLLSRRTRENQGREGTPEAEAERQRTLERLSRAAEAMRDEAEASGSEEARRAAEALSEAAEELSRGARQAAAEAIERAARQSEAMERQREAAGRQAEALARLMEASGLLERAVQLAMAGQEGEGAMPMLGQGEGRGEGEGEGASQGASEGEMAALRRALAQRLSAMGDEPGTPGPGPGGHMPDRGDQRREGLEVDESARARSYVGEGERATQAVRGLGQNGEPTHAYREVFPSYGAIAEEAMADQTVPPLRRDAVRRYFEGIRPGGGQSDQDRGRQ